VPRSPRIVKLSWTLAAKTLEVRYDLPLKPGALDPANWRMEANGIPYSCVSAVAGSPTASDVTAVFTVAPPPLPPPGVRAYYEPPPYDLIGANGAACYPIDGVHVP
jgi:hypothetical protein